MAAVHKEVVRKGDSDLKETPSSQNAEETVSASKPTASTRRKFLGVSAALGVSSALGVSAAVGVAGTSASAQGVASSLGAEEGLDSAQAPLSVAILIFDQITQLDATAPLEVFAKAGLNVFTVAPALSLVRAGSGLRMMPDYDYATAPQADILCVPGGGGVNPLLTDSATLVYLRGAAKDAQYVTSVCTGALLLGAAGLLKGKRATTHWASHHFLEPLGAVPVKERVVIDGNVITGGGVTAGVDFAFSVVDEVIGREAAALVMLSLEYDPAPPFAGGVVAKTADRIVARYNDRARDSLALRGEQVAMAAAKLGA